MRDFRLRLIVHEPVAQQRDRSEEGDALTAEVEVDAAEVPVEQQQERQRDQRQVRQPGLRQKRHALVFWNQLVIGCASEASDVFLLRGD